VSAAADMPEDVMNVLFSLVDPLADAHADFLLSLEQKLSTWDEQTNISEDHVGQITLPLLNILPVSRCMCMCKYLTY